MAKGCTFVASARVSPPAPGVAMRLVHNGLPVAVSSCVIAAGSTAAVQLLEGVQARSNFLGLTKCQGLHVRTGFAALLNSHTDAFMAVTFASADVKACNHHRLQLHLPCTRLQGLSISLQKHRCFFVKIDKVL